MAVILFLIGLAVFVLVCLSSFIYIDRKANKDELTKLNNHLSYYLAIQDSDVTVQELAYILEHRLDRYTRMDFNTWSKLPMGVARHLVIDRDPRKQPYTRKDLL